MEDTNINAVISRGPKISCDKVKDAVSPKARRKTSACAASSLPVNVKSSPTVWHSCLLLLNAQRSHVRKAIHNTHRTLVFFPPFLQHHVLSGERTVKDPLKKPFARGKYPNRTQFQFQNSQGCRNSRDAEVRLRIIWTKCFDHLSDLTNQ